MNNQSDFETKLQERLEELKAVPPRNRQVAARARARFLAQAVAASESRRRTGWSFIFRKRQFAMNLVVTVAVIAGLLIGGGTTVRAAQDDLPNQPLYAIKTLSEDISLQLENDPEAKVDRLMELAQRRVQEISTLVEAGQIPPERVKLRLEEHLQQTLQLCSDMDDAELDQKLLQVREQLQQQEQDMQHLQMNARQAAQPVLEQTRAILQAQLGVVNNGLVNHEEFRNTVRNGPQNGQNQAQPTSLPARTPTPRAKEKDASTPQPDEKGNDKGKGIGPHPDPKAATPDKTPPANNGNNGNNGNGSGSGNKGGTDKGPKDKDHPGSNNPNDKKPDEKTK